MTLNPIPVLTILYTPFWYLVKPLPLISSKDSPLKLNTVTLILLFVSAFTISTNGLTSLFNADSSIFVSVSKLMAFMIMMTNYPNCLLVFSLTCRTLVILDLRCFQVKGFDFSSIGFGFPSLKVIQLNDMVFHEVRDFLLLLAGCSMLAHLRAVDIHFHSEEEDSLTIQEFKSLSLPKLICADITQWWCSWFPVKALSNSEELCLDTFMFRTKDHKVYKANQLQPPYDDIPIFHNLTRLELYDNWELVAQVLEHCPKLQILELNQESYETTGNEEDDQEDWVEPELVPQCLSSCLRTCTINAFSGLHNELMLAKYILKNARILQIMKISIKRDEPEIERKLSTFPKASATCKLLIY